VSQKALESTGNNEYGTPWDVFNHWHGIFNFELDVCGGPNNAKLANYYDKDKNCFKTPWMKRNWMNPPYGKPEFPCKPICNKKICQVRGHHNQVYQPGIGDFIKRAYEQSLEGRLVVALIPSSRATEWWQSCIQGKADLVYDYPKRINFLLDGKPVIGVAFDPCVVIWGLHPRSASKDLKAPLFGFTNECAPEHNHITM
jgi:hypothetical protein